VRLRRLEPELEVSKLELDLKKMEARTEAEVRAIEGRGEGQFLIEKATGQAEARSLEGGGEGRFLVEKATGKKDAAELEASAIERRARADAYAKRLIGTTEAYVRAVQLRQALVSLQPGGVKLEPEVVGAIMQQLARTLLAVDDLPTFAKALSTWSQRGYLSEPTERPQEE